ncbi:MAG: hypothetical protein ACREOB_05660 [Thermodesulfobacteriota bacterium]
MRITGLEVYVLIVFVISLAIASTGYFLGYSAVMNLGLGGILGNFIGYGFGKWMFRSRV